MENTNHFRHLAADVTPIWQHQNHQQQIEKNIPTTVHPATPFDAGIDAEALHKAMKGLGTDEKVLMTILCHRSSGQRVLINQAYKYRYGKDLESKLKSELSGNFERVMVSLCLSTPDFMAREMYEAMAGWGTNDETLIEILCSSTNQELRQMNAAYLRDISIDSDLNGFVAYGHSMEKDIVGDTSGTFKMILVSLTQGGRDDNELTFDKQKIRSDTQRLYDAGEARLGTDESEFNSILATRSWAHLRHIMAEYQSMFGKSLEDAVKSEFSCNAAKVLLGILQCSINRHAYFAERLSDSMKGLGTNDRTLIRLIVGHCDTDLGNIQQEYEKKFIQHLATDVVSETSGDYRRALMALLGSKSYMQ